MKLPGRPVLYPLLIAVGVPLGVMALFGIEKWDQLGIEYRNRSRRHSEVVSWASMRRKNLERVVSGKAKIDANSAFDRGLVGLGEGESTAPEFLRNKIKKFLAVEVHNKQLADKYDLAYRYYWFLPASADPKPPEMP